MRIAYMETGERRPPKKGEWFLGDAGTPWKSQADWTAFDMRILACVEIPDDKADELLNEAKVTT